MTRANQLPLCAAFALALGCSSQSFEAVGSVSCLRTPELAACGGAGGLAGEGGSGGRGGASGTGFANSLMHRYSLEGSGTIAYDSVGKADGAVVNTLLDGTGALSLVDDRVPDNQTADQFVDLPNQLISGLRNATFEAWLTWAGGPPWQRIFDFGDDTTGIEDNRTTNGNGRTYLFLTPKSYVEQGALMRVSFASAQVHEVALDSAHPFPINVKTHVAVVVDSDSEQLSLYMNGEFERSMNFASDRLMLVHDINNWLGRSNYSYDPCLTGTYYEFRIYSAALNASQVRESYSLGSDSLLP